MIKSLFVAALVALGLQTMAQPYKNPSLPVSERVQDLLSRMTVDEKVAQLRSTWSAHPRITDELLADPHQMDSLFGEGLGMINPDFDNDVGQSIRFRNEIQDYFRRHTRLGIPVIFLDEAHHGLLARKVDVFPTSIGLACSWDTALVESVYSYVAGQAASRGTSMVLAPVVDVDRDPRWGRSGETFGEDPYLNGLMGSAVVRGFQGSSDGSIAPGHVGATLKHFTGHGEPEGGVNQGPADFPERVLRSIHLEPFRLAIARAHPAGLMAAYVEIDGVPCHANSWLLKDVLRKEWHYQGVVVSDWWGIDQLYEKHLIAPDRETAAQLAFEAGVTVDLPVGSNFAKLNGLYKAGKIALTDLDKAVIDVLTLKFKLGLFDRPADIQLDDANAKIGRPEGRKLALKAAEESMVLLKNESHILPLEKGRYHKIAVVGPCAAVDYTGDYSGVSLHAVSLLEGIRNKVGNSADVVYAKGVDLSLNGDTVSLNNFQYIDQLIPPDHQANLRKIDSTVAVVRDADIIVCAVGENEQYSREAEAPRHYGDNASLNLQGDQDTLLRALVATGKPVIVYLANGRPLSAHFAAERANAIVEGWFTGQESGNAFANILFGDVNPSGKLTISVPRGVGQIPVFYNHQPSAQFLPYVNMPVTPLYPFGYGLSFTSFHYGALHLDGNQVSVVVTNTGKRAGDEIVQLYVHPKVASVAQPVKALRGFARISLQPGESHTVSFAITDGVLAYYTIQKERRAEPGIYELMIGPNSADVQKIDFRKDE